MPAPNCTATHRYTVALLLFALCRAPAAQEPEHVDAVTQRDAAPVVVDGTTLFYVSGSPSFPSALRARSVSDRIVAAAADRNLSPSDIRAVKRETRIDILARNKHLVAVVDADAMLERASEEDVAQARVLRIQESISSYRVARQPAQLARSSVIVLLMTIAAAIAGWLVLRAFRAALTKIERHYIARAHGLTIRSFELVRVDSMWNAAASALRALRIIVLVALGDLYLSLALSEFPWTRGAADRLFDLVVTPLHAMGRAVVQYLPKLVFLVLLFFVVRYALKLLGLLANAITAGKIALQGFDADWAQPTYNIVRALLVLLAIVVAYPYLPGSNSPAFQGLSIFAGLILSLGASSAMSSVIAGYTLTYRRAFRVGDRITIGEITGEVIEVRLLVTHLRTIKNEEVILPNSTVLQSHIVNYSKLAKTHGLILHTTVGIGYETPWRQVEAMLLIAAERTQGLLRAPQPFVLETALGDFAITYELNAFVADAQGIPERYAAMHRNVLDVFNEHGIQIMTPAYEGDPEKPKVVEKEQWYASPARPLQKLGTADDASSREHSNASPLG